MTVKEAILKSLEEIGGLTNYSDVTAHIIANNFYDFKETKTPQATVCAQLGDFIRKGDVRVKRINKASSFFYYLAKNEHYIDAEIFTNQPSIKKSSSKTYNERDLHRLLSSYLNNISIFSKTIYHEQSNGKDSNQIWTHPDMVGVNFLTLQNKTSQNFFKTINQVDTFKLNSYELKKEINSDTELKKAYFQAVSNSSWANYGYLVAFDFSDNLQDEMERLNQSFGIGIIELNGNPYESKVLYPAKHRELDFKTIDKLCLINKDFEQFVEQIEKLLTADDRYFNSTKKEFSDFCDSYLITDTEIEEYCREKFIPFGEEVIK